MTTTTSVVATATLVVAGRLAQSKPVDVKIAVGAGALAVSLSVLNSASSELASRFALLILVIAAYLYVPSIAKKTGLIK